MKKAFRTVISTLFLILISFANPVFVSQANAQGFEWTGRCVKEKTFERTDGGIPTGETVTTQIATIEGLECLIANIFSVIITVIGLAGFVMIIVAAFKWMFSGSTNKGAESARNTLTFAVAGIVLSLSAFIILNLIREFTGVQNIGTFLIPDSNP